MTLDIGDIMKRNEILNQAKETLLQRQTVHGDPHKTFTILAEMWNVTPYQVAMMLAELKMIRARANPANDDNYLDAIGYIALAYELKHNQKEAMVGGKND